MRPAACRCSSGSKDPELVPLSARAPSVIAIFGRLAAIAARPQKEYDRDQTDRGNQRADDFGERDESGLHGLCTIPGQRRALQAPPRAGSTEPYQKPGDRRSARAHVAGAAAARQIQAR